ncbi:hypothetical protein KIN20_019140 [Parelaphostrongylus tenuis]|uniref:Uncharacterized protein n=1 Tax=Parelaphostrongylus tenuis TaxID=148309 RepID=A0AAD5MP02_PARTN|nr:hypothetical protein KIN20_019140 [Parelaphostrongylus tenuis]
MNKHMLKISRIESEGRCLQASTLQNLTIRALLNLTKQACVISNPNQFTRLQKEEKDPRRKLSHVDSVILDVIDVRAIILRVTGPLPEGNRYHGKIGNLRIVLAIVIKDKHVMNILHMKRVSRCAQATEQDNQLIAAKG